jgi:hypothetical protein
MEEPRAGTASEPSSRPSVRKAGILVLFLGLALAATAQMILLRLPRFAFLRPDWVARLAPVWLDPQQVLVATLLFLFGAVIFGISSKRMSREPPLSFPSLSSRGSLRSAPLASILILLGVALDCWILTKLWTNPSGPSYGALFLLTLTLLVAGVAGLERWRLAPASGRTPPPFAVWEVACVAGLLGLFLWLNLFDVSGWYYSVIGDEYSFYFGARHEAEGSVLNLFSQRGTYGLIPVFSSWIEGMLMRILGTGLVGWKAATVLPAAGALAMTYLIARNLYSRRVAFLTLGMLATAHYLLAWGHTGYPSLEPLFPTAGALLLFVLGRRRLSATLLFASGLFAGLGWYTYYNSRCAIVILACAIVLTSPPSQWIRLSLPVAGGFAVLFLPMLVVNRSELITSMLDQTFTSERRERAAGWLTLTLFNAGRSLLAFNYNTHHGPFLAGSLAEPVTAMLFPLGLGYAVATGRDARSRLLLAWFVIGLATTGVVSRYDAVAVSRLHFMMPVVALLAALALDRTLDALAPLFPVGGRALLLSCVIAAALLLVTASNLYRWFVEAPSQVASSVECVTFRVVEKPECQSAALPPLIVDVGIGGGLPPALEAHGGLRSEFALYKEQTGWLETVPSRCVIFRAQHDEAARVLMTALQSRWPKSRGVEEYDRAKTFSVRVYYPASEAASSSKR